MSRGDSIPSNTFGSARNKKPQAVSAASSSANSQSAAQTSATPVAPAAPGQSTVQLNAVQKVSSDLNYSALSRRGLIDQLVYEAFSQSEAE